MGAVRRSFEEKIFFTRLLERNCIIVCKVHLDHFLLTLNEEHNCKWVDGEGYWFSDNRRFCKRCVSKYLRKMSEIVVLKFLMNRIFELRKSYCKNCVKHYLNKAYHLFSYENF